MKSLQIVLKSYNNLGNHRKAKETIENQRKSYEIVGNCVEIL